MSLVVPKLKGSIIRHYEHNITFEFELVTRLPKRPPRRESKLRE